MHLAQLGHHLRRFDSAAQVLSHPGQYFLSQQLISRCRTQTYQRLVLPQLTTISQEIVFELIEASDQSSSGPIGSQSKIDVVERPSGSWMTEHFGHLLEVLGPEISRIVSACGGSGTVMDQDHIDITGISHLVTTETSLGK